MGVGSEVYGAVKLGRRGIGVELKPSYFRQAVKNLKRLEKVTEVEHTASLFDDVEPIQEDRKPISGDKHYWAAMDGKLLVVKSGSYGGYTVCGPWEGAVSLDRLTIIKQIDAPIDAELYYEGM
jgi:hypothetical protein